MPYHAQSTNAFLNQFVLESKTTLGPDATPAFCLFLRELYACLALDAFDGFSYAALIVAGKRLYDTLLAAAKGDTVLDLFRPCEKDQTVLSRYTILQIVLPDMPFVIDTLNMELNRLGVQVRLMVHLGGIRVFEKKGVTHLETNCQAHYVGREPLMGAVHAELNLSLSGLSIETVKENLLRVLRDVSLAVTDWHAMRDRMAALIRGLKENKGISRKADVTEAVDYLQWLIDDRFTFLGSREYKVVGKGGKKGLRLVSGSGQGVLRNDAASKRMRYYHLLPKAADAVAQSKDALLILSKTNTQSTVHRPAYTDYVAVKQFNKRGEVCGEVRFVGLYTSVAYSQNPSDIPILRRKIKDVLGRAALSSVGHAGKDLLHILSTFPRDDLFHASTDELYNIGMGILQLQERRVVRLFMREDPYKRYMSFFVYMPRDNYRTELVERIEQFLTEMLDAQETLSKSTFSESILARIHIVVRLKQGADMQVDFNRLEAQVKEMAQSWQDVLEQVMIERWGESEAMRLLAKYGKSFSAGYREECTPRQAAEDIKYIDKVSEAHPLEMSLYLGSSKATREIHVKLYQHAKPLPLADAVPMFENLGARILHEQSYRLIIGDAAVCWVSDFTIKTDAEAAENILSTKELFKEAFVKVWYKQATNDTLNRLVLFAEMSWREVALIRAYTYYYRQLGCPFSRIYLEKMILNNVSLAGLLVGLFKARFSPDEKDHDKRQTVILHKIEKQLNEVKTLDEDRVFRQILSMIRATVRTNYFQRMKSDEHKPYIALKFNPKTMIGVPLPVPEYEIFVYSRRFEGIHLRTSKVARGGLRWSDRAEDYRTEVLGLMKAQDVKNAIIVPSGAKGGFVLKALLPEADRETMMAEGVACYQQFVSGLLDVTDNIVGKRIRHMRRTVCYDGEDSYIVVAADKGTATFSDIANDIAVSRGYWLADAFASGGRTGYDHKKLGITARGAWVSAERHFQELGIKLNKTPVTVVGIGDMSGDVFGNGMLLSNNLQLIAAFNHMHIFLDPTPDCKKSAAERRRLFALPRSTWEDYNPKVISTGGGVYSRQSKSIPLTKQVRERLGLEEGVDALEPNILIQHILKASVDMLWNGGIGTYVKSSKETHVDVGDRANDAVRVNGAEVGARVICEGGNLGCTQLGRVEYALHGGAINTDFVDNSAGVDCSDHEVNIKILLNAVVSADEIDQDERDRILASLSDDVCEAVLRDNYMQNQSISIATASAARKINLHIRYIENLERTADFNRVLESMPTTAQLMERKAAGRGLTRPEIAVLLSYSKNILREDILVSGLAKDPYLESFVERAFPKVLRERFKPTLYEHRLKEEIIATQLSNALLSDMGIAFVFRIREESGASISEVVRAYVTVKQIFNLADVFVNIDALDNRISPHVQYDMLNEFMRIVRRGTLWLLRNRSAGIDIAMNITYFAEAVEQLFYRMPRLLLGRDKEKIEEKKQYLISKKVPENIADKIANAKATYHALNIIEAVGDRQYDIHRAAKIYFMIVDRIDLLWFRDELNQYPANSRWSVLAKASLKSELDYIQRALTLNILSLKEVGSKSTSSLVNAWFNKHKTALSHVEEMMSAFKSAERKDFETMTVVVRALLDLVSKS